MSGCCRGLPAKVCLARPYGCHDEPPPKAPAVPTKPATPTKVDELTTLRATVARLETAARVMRQHIKTKHDMTRNTAAFDPTMDQRLAEWGVALGEPR